MLSLDPSGRAGQVVLMLSQGDRCVAVPSPVVPCRAVVHCSSNSHRLTVCVHCSTEPMLSAAVRMPASELVDV